MWKRLELDRFWQPLLDRPDDPAEVPWSRVPALLAINRLCAPGSDLAVEERWYPSTALDGLLGIAAGKINDTRLYRCLDRLLPHKTKLERHLTTCYGELFQAEFGALLYDLTSSYNVISACSIVVILSITFILNPLRLPIPPPRRDDFRLHATTSSTSRWRHCLRAQDMGGQSRAAGPQ